MAELNAETSQVDEGFSSPSSTFCVNPCSDTIPCSDTCQDLCDPPSSNHCSDTLPNTLPVMCNVVCNDNNSVTLSSEISSPDGGKNEKSVTFSNVEVISNSNVSNSNVSNSPLPGTVNVYLDDNYKIYKHHMDAAYAYAFSSNPNPNPNPNPNHSWITRIHKKIKETSWSTYFVIGYVGLVAYSAVRKR